MAGPATGAAVPFGSSVRAAPRSVARPSRRPPDAALAYHLRYPDFTSSAPKSAGPIVRRSARRGAGESRVPTHPFRRSAHGTRIARDPAIRRPTSFASSASVRPIDPRGCLAARGSRAALRDRRGIAPPCPGRFPQSEPAAPQLVGRTDRRRRRVRLGTTQLGGRADRRVTGDRWEHASGTGGGGGNLPAPPPEPSR